MKILSFKSAFVVPYSDNKKREKYLDSIGFSDKKQELQRRFSEKTAKDNRYELVLTKLRSGVFDAVPRKKNDLLIVPTGEDTFQLYDREKQSMCPVKLETSFSREFDRLDTDSAVDKLVGIYKSLKQASEADKMYSNVQLRATQMLTGLMDDLKSQVKNTMIENGLKAWIFDMNGIDYVDNRYEQE